MSDFSVAMAASGDPKTVVLTIQGAMTVQYAGELREQLLSAFEKADSISADLRGVTEIDIAGLQLLCSAHRSSVAMHKAFSIVGEPGSAVWTAAGAAGQLRQTGCLMDVCHTCIWTGGRS